MSDYTILNLRRNFEAGEEGLELLAFGAPVSVGDDSEILPGWWSD